MSKNRTFGTASFDSGKGNIMKIFFPEVIQDLIRPPKIDFNDSPLTVLNLFIEWYHYIKNTNEANRGIIMPYDVVDITTYKDKKTVEEKFGFGSMTTKMQQKRYSDENGTVIMSFSLDVMNKKNYAPHKIIGVDAEETGVNRENKVIIFYKLNMDNNTGAITMRITGKKLFWEIHNAVRDKKLYKLEKIEKF